MGIYTQEIIGKTWSYFEKGIGITKDYKIFAQIDLIRDKINHALKLDLDEREFLALVLISTITMSFLVIYSMPWFVRLIAGIAYLYYTGEYVVSIVLIASSALRAARPMANNNNNYGFAIGAIALIWLATNNHINPMFSIALLGVAILLAMYSLANKAASHSLRGLNNTLIGATLLFTAVVITAALYAKANLKHWMVCNDLSPNSRMYEECLKMSISNSYDRIMGELKGVSNQGKGWLTPPKLLPNFAILSYVSIIPSAAVLSLFSITRILGRRYKTAGSAHEAANRNGHPPQATDYSAITQRMTTSDILLTLQEPFCMMSVMTSIIWVFFSPTEGFTYMGMNAIGYMLAERIFQTVLAEHYAREGAQTIAIQNQMPHREAPTIIGTIPKCDLNKRTSMIVLVLSCVASSCAGLSILSLTGILAFLIPAVAYTLRPKWTLTIALIVHTAATLSTGNIAIGIILGVTLLASAKPISSEIEEARGEIVINDIQLSH